MIRHTALEVEDMTSFTSNRASPLLPSLFNKSILSIWFPTNDYGAKRFWAADSAFGRFDVLTAGSFSCFSLFFLLIRLYSLSGLHNLLQPGSRAARKWRENEKIKRKWRKNEEMERDALSTFPHFLLFPPSLSKNYRKKINK